MNDHIIVGIHITNRERHAQQVQSVLTKYGEHIKTRLGLHDDVCSENGLILLEMKDTPESSQMIEHLIAYDGVDLQKMIFHH